MARSDSKPGKSPAAPPNGSHHDPPHPDSSWLERNVNLVIAVLVVACLLTLATQWVFGLGFDEHHDAHFPQEKWFGFSAVFGFVAFVAVVFLGRAIRLIVERPEDYYDA